METEHDKQQPNSDPEEIEDETEINPLDALAAMMKVDPEEIERAKLRTRRPKSGA